MKTAIFWIVAILALLFNGFSLYDLFMTRANPAQHLANYPPEFVEMVINFPAWRSILWSTTVFVGVIGAVLLALRRLLAVRALWAAAILLLAGLIADLALLDGLSAYGPLGMVPIIAIQFGFALYASWAARQELLR